MDTNEHVEPRAHEPRARRRTGVAGLTAIAVGATAASALLGLRCAALVAAPPAGAAAVDRWVEVGAAAVGTAAAAWLAAGALIALLCVAAARLGRSWHAGEAALRRVAPAAVRRLARTAVGVGVGAGLVLVPAAAHATPEGEDVPAAPWPAATQPLDLGWQPTSGAEAQEPPEAVRTSETTATSTRAEPARPGRTEQGTVVVHRGDTLWGIVASSLGEGATDAEVLRDVVRWHEANRDVIGDDPDVIHPGQVLRAPA